MQGEKEEQKYYKSKGVPKTYWELVFACTVIAVAGLLLNWVYTSRNHSLESVRYLNANLIYDVSQMMDIFIEENSLPKSFAKEELFENFSEKYTSVFKVPDALESEFFILNSDGKMIFHENDELLSQNLFFATSNFFKKVPDGRNIGLFAGYGPSGERGYVSSYYYKPLDIVLALHTPEHIIFSWMITPLLFSIFIFVLLILVFLALGIYARRILRRPYFLHEGLNRILDGDFHYNIPEKDIGGVDHVAKSFNQMASFVGETVTNLETERDYYKSSERLKGNLVDVVTKRLFVPLKTLKMDFETLLGGGLGELSLASKTFLRLLHRKTSHIISTVEDLVLVDEMESNHFVIKPELSNLEILTNVVVEDLTGLLKSKKLEISVEKNLDVFPDMFVDSFKIKKVIFKLLSNAIKFSKDEKKIKIRLEANEKNITFSIKDQGPGIGKAEQGRVFGRLFKAGNISLTHPEASGLSLYIAQKIIEEHEGQIWFDSTLGKGSTFYFSIPLD